MPINYLDLVLYLLSSHQPTSPTAEIIRITEEKRAVEAEMIDVRAVAVLSQSTAQEEVDALLRRYNEEVRQLKIQLQGYYHKYLEMCFFYIPRISIIYHVCSAILPK